ncbi:hypothetical protein [Nocardia wallacei]|uniref:hypothetical protein n=1 Tax=Nocardia wallacei TaxID=480035 RepID=UPI00245681CD|nr:hypothetical protein [Nocardia wallacei]
MECHLAVQFDEGEPLHFRAERAAATAFAAAAAYLARVTIDDRVDAWMPSMPYQQLWL